MTSDSVRLDRCLTVLLVLAAGACVAEVTPPADYTMAVGQELDVALGTVGPGPAYDTIPRISSATVRFLSVTEPSDLLNPGGPTQLFRFQCEARGRAVITFRRSASDSKTVVVEVQ